MNREIYAQYRQNIEDAWEENRQAARMMQDNLERSPLYLRERVTAKPLQIPKVFRPDQVDALEEIASTTYGIFRKVIEEYLQQADYRALFPFSRELEELILTPRLYESPLPMARFDIFFHEDTNDFYFCEINTDGTSGMNEDRVLGEMLVDNPAHQKVIREYDLQPFELFDPWVRTFLEIYGTYEKKKAHPNVAIVDFLEVGAVREFQEFVRRFQRAGVRCELCDIRSLRYQDGVLYSGAGNPIDAIYRRAVTSDIMSHSQEVQPFLQAVREQNVFLAGAFCTQIIHNKWLFHILHLPRTARFLTPKEQAFVKDHVPETWLFQEGSCDRERVLQNKDSYILKPLDSYGSKGVYAGVECSQPEWEAHVAEVFGKDYICQKYCPQFATDNLDFIYGDSQWHPYINMSGLFVYNGRFAGVYSRQSEGGIIASRRNERVLPTFVAKGRREF